MTALDVWTIKPKEIDTEDEEAEAAAEARYLEGLEDPDKYVPPMRRRLRELLGLPTDDDCLPVTKGQVLAKTVPPDPLLWARALIQRSKDSGSEVPRYSLKSDREAAASAAAAA
eukprot:CAMPEP_0197923608 /NCGR_PEP_ID=MMETSP1439-20131203/94270_1 /TAXON_ID=66791 /ORGANISM="Gonyaulax spinifera, Strain CCMP409" /LENGTH=113 /DNA_ID=CAMNT_0043545995 /DNA_START=24 /DNA_END=365 /DNA_ORIENTATION=-